MRRMLPPLALLLSVSVLPVNVRGEGPKLPADLKDLDLQSDAELRPVTPMKDPATGFTVGGENATPLIRGLTHINGRTIAELEADMRPATKSNVPHRSSAGFLGSAESLLAVMAEDNRYVVEEVGVTHQALARPLRVMAFAGGWVDKTQTLVYHGRRFEVSVVAYTGSQESPFLDETRGSRNISVRNLETGRKMWYGSLLPEMIERYGFYEGKGTRYRVEPRRILEVFDFLQEGTGYTPAAEWPLWAAVGVCGLLAALAVFAWRRRGRAGAAPAA